MDICHITLTAQQQSRLSLFRDQEAYCEALHRIGAVFDNRLGLFSLVTEHMHLVAAESRERSGRLAQATIKTLLPIVSTPFAGSYIRTVDSRSHLRWLVRYTLGQPVKHDVQEHPATFVGSCLPDLVQARVVPGMRLCIQEMLPTLAEESVLRMVGIEADAVRPADRATVRQLGATRLKRAAAAVLAVDPELKGRKSAVVLARRVVVQVARRAEIPRTEVAWALGVSRRTLSNLDSPAIDDALFLAVRRRLTLENLAGGAGI